MSEVRLYDRLRATLQVAEDEIACDGLIPIIYMSEISFKILKTEMEVDLALVNDPIHKREWPSDDVMAYFCGRAIRPLRFGQGWTIIFERGPEPGERKH